MSNVTLSELQNMHRMAAAMVIADPVYLPLFERVEEELQRHNATNDSIARAHATSARYKAIA